jgi:hypothetical protein
MGIEVKELMTFHLKNIGTPTSPKVQVFARLATSAELLHASAGYAIDRTETMPRRPMLVPLLPRDSRYAERMTEQITPNLRDVCRELPEKDVKDAEENVDRYLELVLRIYERIQLQSKSPD